MSPNPSIPLAALPLDRERFLLCLVGELAGTLEEVVGVEETRSYVSLAAQRLGLGLDTGYRQSLGVSRLSEEQVAQVLVDLKRRIGGQFRVVSRAGDPLVLESPACPFGEAVIDRPSMCMMTSNLFGYIAAQNLGYAKVVLEKTLAKRDPVCRVVVYSKPTAASDAAAGREYFHVDEPR